MKVAAGSNNTTNMYILRHLGYVLCSVFEYVKGGSINLHQQLKLKKLSVVVHLEHIT